LALRLATAAAPTPDAVAGAATSALARRDARAYLATIASAGELPHPVDAHTARRRIVEAGLAAVRDTRGPATAALLLAAAQAALDALEPAPAEPVLLNLAGVALYELGALRGAKALFEAAGRLDPELPDVSRNLRELARRRRQNVRVDLPATVSVALGGLEGRAERLASRARPTDGLTVSLVMIVKDEEAVLGRCLASAVAHVDEVVVVDTGSTDGTVAVAREHGAKVVETTWNDSFADARNVSLDHATGDWVLYLDADEELVAADGPRLRELARRTWREGFLVEVTNYASERDASRAVNHLGLRMFRRRPEHRFTGRLHEQITGLPPVAAPEKIESAAVRVEHWGYVAQLREAKDKGRRNLELVERQIREAGATPFLLYNLGTEQVIAGELEAACDSFARASELLGDTDTMYGPPLVNRHTQALSSLGRAAEADRVAAAGLERFPGFTDLVLHQASCARAAGDDDRAETLLRRCLEMGDAPSEYSPVVGSGTFLAAGALARLLLDRGDLDAAEEVLVGSLREHPRYQASVGGLGEVLLRRGLPAPEVVARVAEQVGELLPVARFELATGLYERGHADAAETQLRALLDEDPDAIPARLALAEALLSQQRWDEAAAVAAEVPAGAACAGAAAVTEAFALVAGDRGAEVPALLERTRDAGTHPAERTLLAAWALLEQGAPLPAAVPAGAGILLLTVLEALLRTEQVDRFVRLLPALERVEGLAPRLRRQLLAEMYLRRGLLESAADEWIGVVQELGPDADALRGLAVVAECQGEADDAAMFAAEADALQATAA